MFKKLAIPFLTLTLVSFGACSSNNSGGGTGGAGTGGAGTGGATGTGGAGTGTGGTGTGGTATGTGGEATDAPVDMSTTETGTDTGADTMTEAGGDTAPKTAAQLCTTNPMLTAATPAFSAADFCNIYWATCNHTTTGYTTEAECVTSYTTAMANATNGSCRSYHLCNAAVYDSGNAVTHCGHARGESICM
ncbi:MAG TPA: hypothetical protein VH374_17405 [Polyangia bacterium]|nr:hypothetical protein [Polyangia bacterium]